MVLYGSLGFVVRSLVWFVRFFCSLPYMFSYVWLVVVMCSSWGFVVSCVLGFWCRCFVTFVWFVGFLVRCLLLFARVCCELVRLVRLCCSLSCVVC